MLWSEPPRGSALLQCHCCLGTVGRIQDAARASGPRDGFDSLNCHSRVGGNPACTTYEGKNWFPAFAGMTDEGDTSKYTADVDICRPQASEDDSGTPSGFHPTTAIFDNPLRWVLIRQRRIVTQRFLLQYHQLANLGPRVRLHHPVVQPRRNSQPAPGGQIPPVVHRLGSPVREIVPDRADQIAVE